MECIEANPLPAVCIDCKEEDCYNCDHTGERWYLSKLEEMKLKRKGLQKALERLQRQIEQLDEEIQREEKESEERTKKSWEQFKAIMNEEGIILGYDEN